MASSKSIEPGLSKRVQKALRRLNSEDNADGENTDGETQAKRNKKNDTVQKSKEKEKTIKPSVPTRQSQVFAEADNTSDTPAIVHDKSTKEYIPQREKDKATALKKKLHAIEIFRKSKRGLAKTKKVKRTVRKVKKEAELSESDSN